MKKMSVKMPKAHKFPKVGGGFSAAAMPEGSPAEEAGESASTESSEGGMKRGGMVKSKHGHKEMMSDYKHGHKVMSGDTHGHKEM